MPVLVRRRPSGDLRKAAKAAQDASKFNPDTFSFEEDSTSQHSDSEMDIPRHKLANLPSRQKARLAVRLVTSSPVLHQQYQSDEEQPSPSPEDADDGSEYLSYSSEEEEEFGAGSDEEYDFEDDFDTPIAIPVVFAAAAKAVAMSIQVVGRPSVVDVATLAPMAKRTIPIARPESASFTTLRKFKAPVPTPIRTSFIEATKPVPARNFSNPLQRSDSQAPSQTYSGSSPSSSIQSLASEFVPDLDEGELLIRESDEIQDRSRTILAGTDWDISLESHIPTTYEDYDPFALQPPHLTQKTSYYPEPETPGKAKAWSRFGLKSKIMAAGRKVSKA